MKKLFTLFAAVLMGSVVSFAQTDNTFQFVDADGNVVADGTTWHVYEKETNLVVGTMIPSGLFVKNTTDAAAYCQVDFQVTQISGGFFQICFPSNCITQNSVTNLISTGTGEMEANSVESMQTEWVVKPAFGPQTEVTGTCTATLQLKSMRLVQIGTTDEGEPIYDYELIAKGPKITVVFHNDGTTDGIDATSAAGAEVEAYYTLGGLRLGVPQKGLNIVKYTDGTTRKVVVK